MASENITITVQVDYQDGGVSSGLNSAGSSADKFKTKVDKATQSSQKLNKTKINPKIDAQDKATSKLTKVKSSAQGFASKTYQAAVAVRDKATSTLNKIKSKATSLKGVLAAVGVTYAAGSFLKSTVTTYADFSQTMSQVKAISGATGDEFDRLNEKAKDLGASTMYTGQEVGEGMKYMAMAGWDTSDIENGISGVLSLATATGESLEDTSDIVTDYMTAFHLGADEVDHFSDVMAATATSSNTTVSMLGESFKNAASTAASLGYSVEDTSIALGVMANNGIKSSKAGTSLKSALTNMASPTTSQAAAMAKYGISLTDNEGNMKSLMEVTDNLRDSLGGLSETEQTAAATAIFGKNAQGAMLTIVNESEDSYQKLKESIYDCDGAAQDMADITQDNLAGSWTKFTSAVDGLKNSLGEAMSPILIDILEKATDLMPKLSDKLTGAMEQLDEWWQGWKGIFKEMTESDEWQNADIFGKIDIAWNKLIVEPFSEWWESSGKEAILGKIKTLGSEIMKAIGEGLKGSMSRLLPGGESAGIGDYLVAGLGLAGIGTATSKIFSGAATTKSLFSSGTSKLASSVGTMTVTAATVNVNGGITGGATSALTGGTGTAAGVGTAGTAASGGITGAIASLGSGSLAAGLGVVGGVAGTAIGALSAVGSYSNASKANKEGNAEEAKKYSARGTTKLGMIGTGAATGALIGSVVPGIGTAIGAVTGAGIGGITAALGGNSVSDYMMKRNGGQGFSSYVNTSNVGTTGASKSVSKGAYVDTTQVTARRTASARSTVSSSAYVDTSAIHSAHSDTSAVEATTKANKRLAEETGATTKANRKFAAESNAATRETKSYASSTTSAGSSVAGFGTSSTAAGASVSSLGSNSTITGGNVSSLGTSSSGAAGGVSEFGTAVTGLPGAINSVISSLQSAASRVSRIGAANAVRSPLASNAAGSYIGSYTVSELGEEGPEMVIPLSNHRERALGLWEQAGEILGVDHKAEGGVVGNAPSVRGGAQVTIASGAVQINVTGGNGDVVAAIKAGEREITEAILNAIVDACGTSYKNRTAEAM